MMIKQRKRTTVIKSTDLRSKMNKAKRHTRTVIWLKAVRIYCETSFLILITSLLTVLLLIPTISDAAKQEIFILWGVLGNWNGQLAVSNGKLNRVLTYSFEENFGDRILRTDETKVYWKSGVNNQFDGLHLFVESGPATSIHIRTPYGERTLEMSDFLLEKDVEIEFEPGKQFLVIGRGDPARGPINLPKTFSLPKIFKSPEPKEPVRLPDSWWRNRLALQVTLDKPVQFAPIVRRVSNHDGRLYLEITIGKDFTGNASFKYGKDDLGLRQVHNSLWVSLEPRIGRLEIEINAPQADGGVTNFPISTATTLVETRKNKLYVNGEPFLVKGTRPRNLNDADALYLKALGANTLRGAVSSDIAEKYGFMLISLVGKGPPHICEKPLEDSQFQEQVNQYLNGVLGIVDSVVDSPYLLIAQLANEQGGGTDLWNGSYGFNSSGRLDYLLARVYNEVKERCPMALCGYSNNKAGYRAPSFLEVYEHNSYLEKDHRNGDWPPIETFARWQGADQAEGYRPWVMSEWGANVYMPEGYRFGPQFPALEKIHAWNYPNRWNSYLDAGVNGGTNYCLYDYNIELAKSQILGEWDKGFSQFGVMTFDRHPKLALWELWHLWRDFTIEPAEDNKHLKINYVREYSARDCRLTIESAGKKQLFVLNDFISPERREFLLAGVPSSFRWRIDYTTNGGLPMSATGGLPRSIEEADFMERLKPRGTYNFLRELFDATVMTADGRTDITTLADMQREDGVVPVVFKKSNGISYVTVIHRDRPKTGWYHERISVDLALSGTVCAVDELTGKPISRPVEYEQISTGIRLKNLRVPFWPARYTSRSTDKIEFPVYRVTP